MRPPHDGSILHVTPRKHLNNKTVCPPVADLFPVVFLHRQIWLAPICTTWFLNLVHRRARRSGGAVDLERLCLNAVRPRSSLKAVVTLLTPAAGSSGVMASPSSGTGSSPPSSSGSKSSALARAAPVCLTTKRAATLSVANPPPVFARQPPPLERARVPRGILFQASSSRLAGDAMGSWTPSTLSAAAAAALPAAAGAGGVSVFSAPGAANSRAARTGPRASCYGAAPGCPRPRAAPGHRHER